MEEPALPRMLAAIDLGSNSFHMLVARVMGGQPVVIDRLREPVQLASGLDAENRLGRKARQRALECLDRFAERLRGIDSDGVRAVATSTLRVARNGAAFLDEAERVLGHPIEVVPGREEARLIYLGVSHALPPAPDVRLIVDIGGGSTECILGQQFEPLLVDSLEMGCVSFSRRYFRGGTIRRSKWREALVAARLEVRPVATRFAPRPWSEVFGASGTIRAVADVLRAEGRGEDAVTADGLLRLERELLDAGHADALALPGLRDDRRRVFAGGVVILRALFEGLGLERMGTCGGALREGVLYDLLGRLQHEDVRERTIATFQERYHVDRAQAARVERTALRLFEQVAEAWRLDEEAARHLSWAARLHEIGLALSFEGHHRHAGYIVANADMPGFSRDDKELLGVLLRTHRRKVRRPDFRAAPGRSRKLALRLAVLLRLAVRFHRNRSQEELPEIHLRPTTDGLVLGLPAGWLEATPLTRADLETERERLAAVRFHLELEELPPAASAPGLSVA